MIRAKLNKTHLMGGSYLICYKLSHNKFHVKKKNNFATVFDEILKIITTLAYGSWIKNRAPLGNITLNKTRNFCHDCVLSWIYKYMRDKQIQEEYIRAVILQFCWPNSFCATIVLYIWSLSNWTGLFLDSASAMGSGDC